MKKNFINPEIDIISFDMGMDIVTISGLTAAEEQVAYVLGVNVTEGTTDKSGYVYSINKAQAKIQ